MSLMVGISGIRGIVGKSLTPEVAVQYASAFAEYCKLHQPGRNTVVLGRDGRAGGNILAGIVSSTLLASGLDVRALGVVPTPTIALAVDKSGAAGGIAVTASHNPLQWNGLKFFASSGLFLNEGENEELWGIARRPRTGYAGWDQLGKHTADDTWIAYHIKAVLAIPYLDVPAIRRRRLKAVVDCVNASGSFIVPALLRELGCTVIELNCDGHGVFPHTPEPLPENLTELARRVTQERADIGIAVDPDADRLVLINERGEPCGEEYTVASAVKFVLGRECARGSGSAPPVVVNLSTTRAVDDIATSYGVPVVRTPVGEINVAEKMVEVKSVIGGEGNGGVILPAVHPGRDATVGIGLILQMLTEFSGPLSGLMATLPQYSIAKGKIQLGELSPDRVIERLQKTYAGAGRITTGDGLKIDFPGHWVHLRKSNTEPIMRIIAEARTDADSRALLLRFTEEIRNLS